MADISVNARLRRFFVGAMLASAAVWLAAAQTAQAEGLSPKLLEKLESSSVRVRIAAVVAVSKSGAKNARGILEKALLEDKTVPVRAAAAEGLGRLGDPKALPAIERALQDPSGLVKKVARAARAKLKSSASRAASPVSGPAIGVDLSDVDDISKAGFDGLAAQLQREVKKNIEANRRRNWQVSTTPRKKGYGLITRVRSIKPFSQDGVNGLDVRCEMTVVKLPSKALRLSLRANAAAGVQGKLSSKSKPGLARGGITACSKALAEDFIDYAFSRPPL